MSFDRRTPLFQLAHPPRTRHKSVLLPVWVHQVTAPTGYSRTLDVFQTVVLRLCAAGTRDLDELSRRIGLDATLCRAVVARLVEGDLVRADLSLTETGRATVATGEVAESDPRLLRVFQDAKTGALLPRILIADPVRADVRERRGRWVTIQFGTAGASREGSALALRGGGPPTSPTERDVLEACRGHDMAARSIRGDPRDARRTALAARRVVFHGSPHPAYLVCYCVENDDGSGRTWSADDPFAVGDGRVFADLLAGRLEQDEQLAGVVEALTGRRRRDRAETARRIDRELAADARADVVRVLGEGIREHADVFDHLANIEVAIVMDTARERGNAALSAIRVFECLLPGLNEKFPPALPPSGVPGVREREFVLIAYRLGALSVPPEMCRNCGSPKSNLAGEIIRAVWAAGGNAGHPMAAFIRHRPTLLEDLDRSRILRNRAAHASMDAPAPEELEVIRTLVYEAARHLLGLTDR
ncbi:hypothetical protein ACWGR4_45480 [Embleya sp. NPDC055664]